MSRGTQLAAASENTFTVHFYLASATGEVDSGAGAGSGVTTSVETALVINHPSTGDTVRMSRWTAPWPCRVAEVFVEGAKAASGAIEYRLRRHDVADFATADDIIRNAVSGATTDAIKLSHSAANTYARKRYTGILQDSNVAPYFHVTTVSSDTATGFQYSEEVLAAGDRLSATYRKTPTGNDSVTHIRCIVTLAKLDTVSS